MSDTAAKPATEGKPETKPRPRTDQPWLWSVVLLDDDDHSYEYVIEMMQTIFASPLPKAFETAKRVDTQGRAVCLITHKEHAELKRDQILAFGPDKRIARCKGSMSAIIEPATGDDDEDDDTPS
ncbi:MAG: ATP-dependent Clp protease adaptor ClpS [Phycisphaerales bacterium]